MRERLEAFAEAGWESIPEDEREKWFSRFKFWGVFHHRSGQESYFMRRLTSCGGVLEPGQLREIGEVAREYARGPVENPEFGDAWIDLTTRQSIQLHWLKLEDIPTIWEKLESVGVTSRSAGGDTMRNVSACPVAGVVVGIGTIGGIVYPLVYAAPFLATLHTGYAIVAASMIPIVLLTAWVFQPRIARVANTDGFVTSDAEPTAGD